MKKNFLLTALTITLLVNNNKTFSDDVTDYNALKDALTKATSDINIIEDITVDVGQTQTIYIKNPDTISINAKNHNLDGINFGKSAFLNVKTGVTLELSDYGDSSETENNGIINFNTTKNSIIYADTGSTLSVKNSKFAGNTTYRGVIYIDGDAIADIDNAIIINNFADDETAGISVHGEANITNSYFKGNTSEGHWANGVAILAGDDSAVHIKYSNFIDNKGNDGVDGGVIASTKHSSLYIDNSTFKGNVANGDGGAIYTSIPINFYIENLSFEENKTTLSERYVFVGGAINLELSDMNEAAVIYNSEFSKNISSKFGGAIYFTGADDLYIVDSSFNGNTATISGGAIYSECEDCALNIISDTKDVSFSNNTSGDNPNDIYNACDINLFASDGHKITFNGGMDSESIANNLNINNGTKKYTLSDESEYTVTGKGEVQFNNTVDNLNVNVNANDKGIKAGKDDLEGLVVDNHELTVNDAKDFSGFNVAVDNNNGGTVNLKDSNFTGNTGEAAVKNNGGDINIYASKTGYNFEFKEGKYIIQPNILLSYSFINTFDYTNAVGIRMTSDPLHAIQVEPGLKFISNLNNGWQPYLGVSFVYNILDKTNFTANDVSLPELSVKPFVKYGVGVRKSWGERLVGYLQTYITNGGRNGIGIQTGFRFSLGK